MNMILIVCVGAICSLQSFEQSLSQGSDNDY